MTSLGSIKWARLRGLMSSLAKAGDCVGRKPLIRENIPVCVGGGRFKIDLPGIGMVTADEEGEHDEDGLAIG